MENKIYNFLPYIWKKKNLWIPLYCFPLATDMQNFPNMKNSFVLININQH